MRFRDKVVVVTGAARGIGNATARQAAREGARLAIVDLSPDAVAAAAAGIEQAGGEVIGLAGDISDLEQVRGNVADIMAHYGRIDILVNNAGLQETCPARDLTEDHWRREVNVNLTGCFFWTQSVANASMIPDRRGSIVNVGSGASLAAMPNSVSYVAAKHGMVGMTKALAVDWGQYGIRVNCVCPGFTWTELARSVAEKNPEMMRQRVARIPLGEVAQPEDPAQAILFLASDDARHISGQALSVDGASLALASGYSAPRDDVPATYQGE